MALQPQDVIGAYRITEELGSGGMATVYRAYHQRLDRDVAIKVLHAAFQADADFQARFDREAKIVARLEHPNIVPVYDFDEHNGQPYLVMKHLEGQTLKDVLDQRTLTLDEIVRILDAVADALTYAHEQGVLHRDVKPSNIILDERGNPYLTDFGLARIVQTGESTLSAGMIVGTPNYVSPEQAEGESEISEKSDVYSLGVLLYEMVVGRLPFRGRNPYATVHMHIYESPPLPSEVNPEVPTPVEMVLLQALEKDPTARHQSPRALADDFKRAVQQAGLTSLSADRSGVFQSDVVPMDHGSDADPSKPKNKPKRGDSFNSTLLLLEDEESWANLPRDEIARRRIKKRQGERIGLIGHAIPFLAVNALIIFGSVFDGDFSLGSFIPALGWGAGLIAHALSVYFGERGPTERLYQDHDEYMSKAYGRDWRESTPDVDIYREWRKAQERFEQRKGFFIHAGVFVMINLLIWLTWVIAMADGGFVFPYPLIVSAAWGFGLFANWNEVRNQKGLQTSSESVQAEMDMIAGYGSASRKRKNHLEDEDFADGPRLTEDGEFTDSTVEKLERGR
jgi:serine/threonine protein kinase